MGVMVHVGGTVSLFPELTAHVDHHFWSAHCVLGPYWVECKYSLMITLITMPFDRRVSLELRGVE
jgi:hypothetical protein